ncbi:hypothetical protein GGI25_004726 [Coemansia spiralis]|uniref:Uncharacterized protein n=2 Tax=Coemansia TaxID=4863 RepID=A0A9W8KWC4_9FUNG|nr:hypothetical protein EDC05_004496 [Coemansia umbellata]KAJ2620507.1 hypothetical protein GGI26_004914 [Coemansia sp. RSA 1358]KAJ2673391.1 hypothetical protein GGI25_004726 [Coemansia spiralis]
MSATTTFATSVHSLCLFANQPAVHEKEEELAAVAAESLGLSPDDGRVLSTTATANAATPTLSPKSGSSAESSIASSSSRAQSECTTDSSWPMAVDALAQRLWDCGRNAISRHCTSTSSSSSTSSSNFLPVEQLEPAQAAHSVDNGDKAPARHLLPDQKNNAPGNDDDGIVLCDGPYVHVDYAAAPPELTAVLPLHPPSHTSNNQPNRKRNYSQKQMLVQQNAFGAAAATATGKKPFAGSELTTDSYFAQMADTKSLCRSPQIACDRLQLVHYQPMTNPFKTMAKSTTNSTSLATSPITANPTANSASGALAHQTNHHYKLISSPASPSPTSPFRRPNHYEANPSFSEAEAKPILPCVHCKRGNFLEFCFVNDRCGCNCHSKCPCNPCTNIRSHRTSLVSIGSSSSRSEIQDAQPTRCANPATTPVGSAATAVVCGDQASMQPLRQLENNKRRRHLLNNPQSSNYAYDGAFTPALSPEPRRTVLLRVGQYETA